MSTTNYAGNGTLNTSGITTVNFDDPANSGNNAPTINASGITTINANSDVEGTTTLNLARGGLTMLKGTFGGYGETINGAPGSLLVMDSSTISGAFVNIDANVVGVGTLNMGYWHDGPGTHDISGYYGSGLTFITDGAMTVEDPHSFFAKVDFESAPTPPWSNLLLAGLSADSYDFMNDLLTLYKGNTAIYSLHMRADTAFVVQDVNGGVSIIGQYPSGSGTALTGLPMHTGV